MNTLKLFFISSLLLLAGNTYATVRTVYNGSGSQAQFSDVTAAIAASNNGDTLYLSPSSVSYGNFLITKSVTIIGKGSHSAVQIPIITLVGDISIGTNLANITITGVKALHIYFGNGNHHINLNRCNLLGYIRLSSNVNNCSISNCIFEGANSINITQVSCGSAFYTNINDILIQNNIFNGYIESLTGTNYIQNNLFLNNTCAFSVDCNHSNYVMYAIIQNNIFYGASPDSNTANCTFLNNITYKPGGTFLALGGSNIDNTNPLFVNFSSNQSYFSYAYDFHLQPNSPARLAGNDGTDLGIYGGNNPISVLGEPLGVPVIRKMNILNFNVPSNGNVNVNVKSTISR